MTLGRLSFLFNKLFRTIEPIPGEVGRAARQYAGIRSRLSKSFNVARIIPFGSHSKRTAIRRFSDFDVLVIIRKSDLIWGSSLISSETLLGNIKDELQERYPSTETRRDKQAVVVQFGGGEHAVDVVPAIFHSPSRTGHPIYLIPDGSGDWLPTSPDAQLKRLKEADAQMGNKLRKIMKLFKWWKFSRQPAYPLNMMHLEMFLTSADIGRIGSYSRLLTEGFIMLARRRGRSIRDPLDISGMVPIARTPVQCEKVLSGLKYAAEHAFNALVAEEEGNLREAVRQWKIVFNDTFPGLL
jgi:predicted nucleotidyltransferase